MVAYLVSSLPVINRKYRRAWLHTPSSFAPSSVEQRRQVRFQRATVKVVANGVISEMAVVRNQDFGCGIRRSTPFFM